MPVRYKKIFDSLIWQLTYIGNAKVHFSKIVIIIITMIFSPGLMTAKDFTDNLGNVYSTDKKIELGYTEFIQVHGESVLLMEELYSTRSITTVRNKDFMQLVDRKEGWCFVRAFDSDAGYIEGWIKDNKIKRKKDGELILFYGRNLLLMEDIIQKRPAWVFSDSTTLLTLPKSYANNVDVLFFNTKIFIQQEITDYFQVKVYDEYDQIYTDGWILKKDVTEDENMLSGEEEIITESINTVTSNSVNNKNIEIKARLESLEKQRKIKESDDLTTSFASKEVLLKAMKLKKYNEDITVLNSNIAQYQQKIDSEKKFIQEYSRQLESTLSQISEQEKLVYGINIRRIEAGKDKKAEIAAVQVKKIDDKQFSETEYANSGTLDNGSKDRILKKRTKRFGFKHSFEDAEDDKYIILNNWNREKFNIDLLVKDKQITIINLYKKYKTQDNLLTGQFTLKFDMASDGKTKKVRITESIWSNPKVGNDLNKEIEKKVRTWVFPPDNHIDLGQRKDKPVSVPYIF